MARLERDGTAEPTAEGAEGSAGTPADVRADDTGSCDERQAALRAGFHAAREHTEALAAPLSAEDQTVQSMPDVSPTKWHRAHTTWFFETFVLSPELRTYEVFDPAYAYLFNSYYETLGARHPRPQRGLLSRPGVAEVASYRRHADAGMDVLFGRPLPGEVLDLVELGIHHEQQHQELLLMDIKHVLGMSPLVPPYAGVPPERAGRAAGTARKTGWIEHEGGVVEIGHGGRGFAFDNESPRHRVHLVPFALAERLVTCEEWLEFVDDGGYTRPELWLSEGWATRNELGWSAPLYWERHGEHWTVFTLFGPVPLDPSEPVVHVSYFEADAFARWSGARLPTEAEWEDTAVSGMASGGGAQGASRPLALHPGRATRDGGAQQLFGSAWQWTSSAYSPYPGFRPAPGAVGEYNGKFMVNQQVLRGSACVTPTGHARPTYRNFFPASARWAFSGLRLARDL